MPGQRKIEDSLIDTFVLGEDYVKSLRMKYPWVERAVSSGLRLGDKSGFTAVEYDDELKQWMVFPTVRRKRDKKGKPKNELEQLELRKAQKMAKKNKDYIPVPSLEAGQLVSHGFSRYQGMRE